MPFDVVPGDMEISPMGTVHGRIKNVLVVQSNVDLFRGILGLDSILSLENRKVLGRVRIH